MEPDAEWLDAAWLDFRAVNFAVRLRATHVSGFSDLTRHRGTKKQTRLGGDMGGNMHRRLRCLLGGHASRPMPAYLAAVGSGDEAPRGQTCSSIQTDD